jgi:hypothetical protein
MKYYECQICGQKVMAGGEPKCECPCCHKSNTFIQIILPSDSEIILGQIDGDPQ